MFDAMFSMWICKKEVDLQDTAIVFEHHARNNFIWLARLLSHDFNII